jgi:hypothetical protein
MAQLLDEVLEAHGGMKRWNEVQTITGNMSIVGTLWERKGWKNVLQDVEVTARAHEQWITYRRFTDESRRSVCRPDLTAIETSDGILIKERRNPRVAFVGHTPATPWDDLNLAYFSGYAMWNYLTAPFLFTYPGVTVQEIDPWTNDGKTFRRLKVIFPDTIATHCAEQVFHLNDDSMLHRVDYSAAVTGGTRAAHVMYDYKDAGGIKIATKRRAYLRNEDGTARPEPITVQIDMSNVHCA